MEIGQPVNEPRIWSWLRLTLGVSAIAVGVAAFAWPDATIRVVGLLFGLNLLVTGLVRAVLGLAVEGYPVLYRVIAVIFGVLTAILGILCLRNITASAILLVLIIGIGWLLDGIVELALGIAGPGDPMRGWRIAMGVAVILAAGAVLVWPGLGLLTFLTIGALVLVIIGVAHVIAAVGALRLPAGFLSPHTARP